MSIRLTAAAALVVAGFALIAALLIPSPPARAMSTSSAPVAAVDPVLAALAPSADLDEETATALDLAADRVCEGLTAGVPVDVMTETLSAELSLTLVEARTLVDTATTVRCR